MRNPFRKRWGVYIWVPDENERYHRHGPISTHITEFGALLARQEEKLYGLSLLHGGYVLVHRL